MSSFVGVRDNKRCFLFLLALLGVFWMYGAEASNTGGINQGLCVIINISQGNIMRALASIAVVFLGVSMFLGKITWGQAAAVAVALGGIFGAKTIVLALSGGTVCSGALNAVGNTQSSTI